MGFIYNDTLTCPFCEHVQNPEHILILSHWLYLDEPEAPQENHWIQCQEARVLNVGETQEIRQEPYSVFDESDDGFVVALSLDSSKLRIMPRAGSRVWLQRIDSMGSYTGPEFEFDREQKLDADKRTGRMATLRIDPPSSGIATSVWRFKW